MKEFEQLLKLYGDKHQKLLRERAKDGDKSLHYFSSIQELLWLADDTIECLAWLAKNHSEDCERHAEGRLNWPGFISVMASINRQSKEVIKYIPLGKKFSHYNWKTTKVDMLFWIAHNAIIYFSEHPYDNTYSSFFFTQEIKGVEWMKRQDAIDSIKKYCSQIGMPSKANWPKWKPIFTRFIAFHYGPSHERWNIIPDTSAPTPPVKAWREYKDLVQRFGTKQEWYSTYGKALKLSPSDREELKKMVASKTDHKSHSFVELMDVAGDKSLMRLRKRAKGRNAKWGDYQHEILRRCQRLLPKN